MAHSHQHTGSHHHHHASDNIKVALFLNLGFTVIEIVGGLWINSIAILSDALHDLGDSLALGLAWYFEKVARRGSDQHYSYGYKRFSLLGAVINAVILLVGSLYILSEAIPRLFNPEQVYAPGMIGLAMLGLIANGAAVLRLKKGSSLNERVAMLHLLEDVMGWAAVLIGGVIMHFFDLPVIDPILSVGITCFVVYNVVRNLRQSLKILLQGTPLHIDLPKLKEHLEELPQVKSVHDLHLWTLDGSNHILTLHAVVPLNLPLQETQQVKHQIRAAMANLAIHHVTIELETPGQECSLTDCST